MKEKKNAVHPTGGAAQPPGKRARAAAENAGDFPRVSEEQIVELFWRRDERALTLVDERYGRMIASICFSILGSREDSEECRNLVYQALWSSIPPQKPVSLKAYTIRLSQNEALEKYKADRRQKRIPTAMTESLDDFSEFLSDTDVESEVENRELAAFLNSYVRALPERKRSIFVKRYYYAQTILQISQQTGLKQDYIKKQLQKIKTDLRRALEERKLL